MHKVRHPRSQMTRKIVLLCVFTTPTEPSRFASLAVTPWGYKADVVAPV
jgi:hypothetical protein